MEVSRRARFESLVHLNQTLQRTHQCIKEDKNPHHQQQQGAKRDYINIDDLLQDMRGSDGGGVGDDEQDDFLGPKDAEIFENLANRMDQDDILFGNSWWLENFKEMK